MSEQAPTDPISPDSAEPPASVVPTTYRSVMRYFPTAVTVLTAMTSTGPRGMTASSVTSLSLEPELLIACVRQHSRFADALNCSGGFVVNVLDEQQSGIARWFASPERFTAADEFLGVPWYASPGSRHPRLADTIGVIECRTTDLVPRGDHVIAIGEIVDCGAKPSARPLLRYVGEFRRISAALSDGSRTGG